MGFDEMDVDTIWKNGEYLDWEDATTHVLTHALHYGSGVFEGVRCYDTEQGPAIFRWEEHLDRLFDSAKMYDMEIEYSRGEITEATLELLDRQDLDSAYIRPLSPTSATTRSASRRRTARPTSCSCSRRGRGARTSVRRR